MIGTFVPVILLLVFILPFFCYFSKGPERFFTYLYQHEIFGLALRFWSEHRVMPMRAKVCTAVGILFCVVVFVAMMPERSTLYARL